ncbi:hypothetical protein ANCDUO_27233, partial [Ancylostoma duodenale]
LKSANNKDINVRGHFNCNYNIEGHEGKGTFHVANTMSLLGLIAQNGLLFRRLRDGTICDVSVATLRASLTKQLQK